MVAVRRQYLWIHLGFNPNEGLVLVLVLAIVVGVVLFFLNNHELLHFHNNVFQLGLSLITSNSMPLYKNARRILIQRPPRMRCWPILRKNDEHMAPQAHSYIVASMETSDAQFENLDIP